METPEQRGNAYNNSVNVIVLVSLVLILNGFHIVLLFPLLTLSKQMPAKAEKILTLGNLWTLGTCLFILPYKRDRIYVILNLGLIWTKGLN